MAKTKAKASRMWNSLVRINGGARFSRLYTIGGAPEQNRAGQEYYSLQVRNAGYVSEPIFKRAGEVYDLIRAGRVSAAHASGEDAEDFEDM